MVVMIIDGQGGGIGAAVIKAIRQNFGQELEIWGLGTNAMAAAQMLKAGANRCASGENAIIQSAKGADVILGALGVVLANSMMGEMTPAAAEAVNSSPAWKILLPLSQERVRVVGVLNEPLPHLIEIMMGRLREVMSHV